MTDFPVIATCRECGTPYTGPQLVIAEACDQCGSRFVAPTPDTAWIDELEAPERQELQEQIDALRLAEAEATDPTERRAFVKERQKLEKDGRTFAKKRRPLDLGDMRRRLIELVEAGEAERLKDMPQLFELIGELARAVAALAGSCTCRTVPVQGKKPGAFEPCPHRRAQRALARAGIRLEDIGRVRKQLGLVVP